MSIYLLNSGEKRTNTAQNGYDTNSYISDPENIMILYKRSARIIISSIEDVSRIVSKIAKIHTLADENDEYEQMFRKKTDSAWSVIQNVTEMYKGSIAASELSNNADDSVVQIVFLVSAILERIKLKITRTADKELQYKRK